MFSLHEKNYKNGNINFKILLNPFIWKPFVKEQLGKNYHNISVFNAAALLA